MSRIGNEITLEQIDEFFTIGKEVSNVRSVPRSCARQQKAKNLVHCNPDISLNTPPQPEYTPSYKRRSENGNEKAYAAEYKQRHQQELLYRRSDQCSGASCDITSEVSSLSGMEKLERDTVISGATATAQPQGQTEAQSVAVYNNYNFNHRYDPKLSITKYREEIVNIIETNHVTVIEGPTGCGKTTQVPQYILDYYHAQNKHCNIVVTQPRRIAAVGVAKRVCKTRDWHVGGICGYQVGMDRDNRSEDTRLLYCTTGVLKNRLIRAQHMNDYTHIVLDEVHERELETDFLLLVVRKFLYTTSPNVKVIVMSATINADLFAAYFAQPLGEHLEPAPIFKIEENRQYEVKDYYIEDLKALGPIPVIEFDSPGIEEGAMDLTKKLILWFDRIDEQEQGGADPQTGFARNRGSVLVFLPGLFDINKLESQLDRPDVQQRHRLLVLPLHSTITGTEQMRVFESAQPGFRKVILSTNIAESSITVKDIKYVIDFCLTKEMVIDPSTTFCSLQPTWASRASLDQRRGRAGRVSSGRCYRMITREFLRDYLQPHKSPEIERCPLEYVVLNAKLLDMGDPKAILSLAMTPPDESKIEYSMLILKEVGALAPSDPYTWNPCDGDLTFMGRILAELPVDIRIGKLMLLGHAFGMLEECIIIAAALTAQSFFARPFKVAFEAYKKKLEWSDRSQSDCIALLKAYQVWEKNKRLGVFKRGGQSERAWGHQNFIDVLRINQVQLLVEDLTKRLELFNIRKPPPRPAHCAPESREEEDELILKIIFCGAFYPNYFYKSRIDEEQAHKDMSGKNHFNTVLVRGMPPNQGNIYGAEIRQLFEPCHSNPIIEFEESRAYVQFPRDLHSNANQYHLSVYLALKMKQLGKTLTLCEMDIASVTQRIQDMSLLQKSKAIATNSLRSNRITASRSGGGAHPGQVELPAPDETSRAIEITEVVDCAHFWCQYHDHETWMLIGELSNSIKRHVTSAAAKPLPKAKQREGVFCLALFEEHFYRAQIQKVEESVKRDTYKMDEKITKLMVFYVDYGNQAELSPEEVRDIPPHLLQTPFQAFECELSEITPSARECPNGRWTKEAKTHFKEMVEPTKGHTSYIQVYSVVYDVVRVRLFVQADTETYDINDMLVRSGYADTCAESHISQADYKKRQKHSLLDHGAHSTQSLRQTEWFLNSQDQPAHHTPTASLVRKSGKRINLYGPVSPFEISWSGINQVTRFRSARVEGDSVNCISLDEDPGATHDRLLCAASVIQSANSSRIRLQHTTILPNIRGLAPLVPVLFAPCVEFRCDRRCASYTGYLCGLGYDSSAQGSALPDHDMEITFDTVFTEEDLLDINYVRAAINCALDATAEEERRRNHVDREKPKISWDMEAMGKVQKQTRGKLLKFLRKSRTPVQPVYFGKPTKWKQLPDELIMRPAVADLENPAYLPLHSGIHLQRNDVTESVGSGSGSGGSQRGGMSERDKKCRHVEYLKYKAQSSFSERITCLLCRLDVYSSRELQLHLATMSHRQQEAKLL